MLLSQISIRYFQGQFSIIIFVRAYSFLGRRRRRRKTPYQLKRIHRAYCNQQVRTKIDAYIESIDLKICRHRRFTRPDQTHSTKHEKEKTPIDRWVE